MPCRPGAMRNGVVAIAALAILLAACEPRPPKPKTAPPQAVLMQRS